MAIAPKAGKKEHGGRGRRGSLFDKFVRGRGELGVEKPESDSDAVISAAQNTEIVKVKIKVKPSGISPEEDDHTITVQKLLLSHERSEMRLRQEQVLVRSVARGIRN